MKIRTPESGEMNKKESFQAAAGAAVVGLVTLALVHGVFRQPAFANQLVGALDGMGGGLMLAAMTFAGHGVEVARRIRRS